MSVRVTMIVIRCVLTLMDHTTAVVVQDLCWQQTREHVEVTVLLAIIILSLCNNELATFNISLSF